MTDRRLDSPYVWPAVILGLALIASAFLASTAMERLRRAGDEISVTGSARRPITSDLATWRGSLEVQRATLPEAAAELDAHVAQVRRFLSGRGFPDSLVQVSAISSFAVREMDRGEASNRVMGYRMSRTVTLTTTDIAAVTALSQAAGELLAAGVPLSPEPPQYLFTKLADLRIEMLGDATKDAQVRAEQIASRSGGEIGRIKSVRQGVFQITPRNSTEIADYGMNDVSAIDKDITAVVRVTFALED
ncbi:MAG TPA: SIMPL domain-containing protein [Gemmatimonadales bacterium]|nr:SIMPL domain-containing protein [Gemmatimonadales bacterium]